MNEIITNALQRLDEILNDTVDEITPLDDTAKRAILNDMKQEADEQDEAGNSDAGAFLRAVVDQVELDMEC